MSRDYSEEQMMVFLRFLDREGFNQGYRDIIRERTRKLMSEHLNSLDMEDWVSCMSRYIPYTRWKIESWSNLHHKWRAHLRGQNKRKAHECASIW